MNVLMIVLLLLVGLPGVAQAAEKRCDALGANCVCSEPFNTATYTSTSWNGGACTSAAGCYWNPSDSTTKECSYETTGAPIATYNDFRGSNDATALSRLPAGHAVTRFAARPEGHSGIFSIGADITNAALGATYNARMALRFYVYHSPTYNFRDDTPPCHSKFLQGSPGSWHFENYTGDIHMYNFSGSNWGPSSAFPRDCCFGAPGVQVGLNNADWRGRWLFVEVVSINRSGPGWRTIVYMRDVTNGLTKLNGGNEFVAADTFGTTGGPQPWTTAFNTVITSNPRQLPMFINGYREVGQGACSGFRGYSHMTYAGWDTDAGQRIGPAAEVEAGGTVPPPTTSYTLTATAQGAGTVSGAGSYPANTEVTPVATANAGATFTGWSGACSGTGGCTVTMTADKGVMATFTGMTTPPPTACAITPTPAAITFTHPPGGPLPAPQSVRVVTSDGSAYRTFDTGFYDAAPCYTTSCPSGTLTTITPMPTTLSLAAGTYTYPLNVTAGEMCPKVTVPVVLTIGAPAPPSTGMLTVTAQVSRCNYFLTAIPPDGTGGWVAQFYRDGTIKVGTAITAPPYKRSLELYAPSHSFTVQFTKTGTTMRSPAEVARVCP